VAMTVGVINQTLTVYIGPLSSASRGSSSHFVTVAVAWL